jgi:hypothetical protein
MASALSAKARTELNVAIVYVHQAARRLTSEPGYLRQARTPERLCAELADVLAKLIAADRHCERRRDGRLRRPLLRPRPGRPAPSEPGRPTGRATRGRLASLHGAGQVWTDPDLVLRWVCTRHRRQLVALCAAGLAGQVRWQRPGLSTGPASIREEEAR